MFISRRFGIFFLGLGLLPLTLMADGFPEGTLFGDTLKAVDITGYRDQGVDWIHETVDQSVVNGKKTERLLIDDLGANTVQNQSRTLFGKAPGITVWESDGSGMQINVASRGLSPNRSWEFNVCQNGFQVAADPYAYPEAYYNPPAEAVEEIRIIRGAAGLQFGPQFGGLLDYRIRQAPVDKKLGVEIRQSAGSYGLWSTFNAIGGTSGRWSYYGYYYHRQGEGWRDNSSYRSDVMYAALDYRFSSRLKSQITFTRSTNKLQQSGGVTDNIFSVDARSSSRARNWFSSPWNILTGSLNFQPDSSTLISLTIQGLFANRNSVGFLSAITVPDTVNTSTGLYAPRQVDRDKYDNLEIEWRALRHYTLFGQRHHLASGMRWFDGTTDRNQRGLGSTGSDADFTITGEYPRALSFDTRSFSAFVENVFQISKRWSLSPGVRWERIFNAGVGRYAFNPDGSEQWLPETERTRSFLLAGVGSEFKIKDSWMLYGNISQAYRPVLFSDLTPPSSTDQVDPELQDARGYTSEVGVRGSWSDKVRLDANLFLIKYADRIGTITQVDPDGNSYLYRTNLGTSWHRGVEAYMEFFPIRLLKHTKKYDISLWTSFALLQATYGDFPLAAPVNGKTNLKGNQVEYAPKRIHRAGATFLVGDLRCDFQYSYTSQVFADAGNTVIPTANAQSGLIPSWSVCDASATYTWRDRYDIRLNLSNVFDARYFTRRSGGYPGPGLLPGEARTIIVGVGVKL